MNEVWFIGDTHFFHTNILAYEPKDRPFSCVEDMNEEMVKRWNSVVKKDDIVWHLGDFCMGGFTNISIAERLNGKKRLVMGNHDNYGIQYYQLYFERIFGVTFYKHFILSHVPVHQRSLAGCINLHGHLHSKVVMSNEIVAPDKEYPMNWRLMPDENYFCVSAEQNNLTPINFDVIREKCKSKFKEIMGI